MSAVQRLSEEAAATFRSKEAVAAATTTKSTKSTTFTTTITTAKPSGVLATTEHGTFGNRTTATPPQSTDTAHRLDSEPQSRTGTPSLGPPSHTGLSPLGATSPTIDTAFPALRGLAAYQKRVFAGLSRVNDNPSSQRWERRQMEYDHQPSTPIRDQHNLKQEQEQGRGTWEARKEPVIPAVKRPFLRPSCLSTSKSSPN